VRGLGSGSALMVTAAADSEQGYEIVTAEQGCWAAAGFDGLTLMMRPAICFAPRCSDLLMSLMGCTRNRRAGGWRG
jgi:hypothetical protein